eukprot:gene17701-biopygen17908
MAILFESSRVRYPRAIVAFSRITSLSVCSRSTMATSPPASRMIVLFVSDIAMCHTQVSAFSSTKSLLFCFKICTSAWIPPALPKVSFSVMSVVSVVTSTATSAFTSRLTDWRSLTKWSRAWSWTKTSGIIGSPSGRPRPVWMLLFQRFTISIKHRRMCA